MKYTYKEVDELVKPNEFTLKTEEESSQELFENLVKEINNELYLELNIKKEYIDSPETCIKIEINDEKNEYKKRCVRKHCRTI